MPQKHLYLENRRVIKVSGLTCEDFLNNILTSDISGLVPLETSPSALLSPQGRVLYDILVSLDSFNPLKEKSFLITITWWYYSKKKLLKRTIAYT